MNNEFENKNNTDNNLGESNNARRLRMLGDDAGENIHLKSDAEVKGAFWPNLWFKHKWAIIIVSVFFITFLILFIQFLTRTKYDIHVVYAGPKYLANFQDQYIEALVPVAADGNGDGEVNVAFSTIVYLTPEQQKEVAGGNKNNEIAMQQANKESHQDFQDLMMSGSMAFFLLDPSLYEEYSDAFGNVSEILGYEVDSELLYADNAVYFKKTEYAKNITAFNNLPNDTILCVMTAHQFTPQKEEIGAIELFKNIMACEK